MSALAELATVLRASASALDLLDKERARETSELLTYVEAGAILKVHRVTVARLVQRGHLKLVSAGVAGPRVTRESLERFIAGGGVRKRVFLRSA